MNSIYDLSWGKTSFLAKLLLFFKSRKQEKKRMCSSDRWVRAEGCSALSSTYYNILGTAFSQLKAACRQKWLAPVRIVPWCFTWLPLATWCYLRMLPLSDRVKSLIGYDGMSADQCDVRQSILRRRGQYEEARKCIYAALSKNPEKAHTRCLLRVGLAEIYQVGGDWCSAEGEVRIVLADASEAEVQDPRQAARIYRRCADVLSFSGQTTPALVIALRRRAKELAKATGAQDQSLKLE
ncbi:MAG: hypothetical protein AAB534_00030 [Patescibacteria group bacterium]